MTQTLSKELAALFRKVTNSHIDEEGNAHCVLTPADSISINSARALLAAHEQEPVSFDELRDAVAEMTGVTPMEWSESTYKGHQVVPFINFNSLARIVEKFRTHPAPVPAVPDECPRSIIEDAELYDSVEDMARSMWSAMRAAMLNGGKS